MFSVKSKEENGFDLVVRRHGLGSERKLGHQKLELGVRRARGAKRILEALAERVTPACDGEGHDRAGLRGLEVVENGGVQIERGRDPIGRNRDVGLRRRGADGDVPAAATHDQCQDASDHESTS